MAEIFQRVPRWSSKPNSSGPKPIENTRTRTPHQRATRKWPSSWKKTTTLKTKRIGRPNQQVTIGFRTLKSMINYVPTRPVSPRTFLRCLCGNFGQELTRQQPRIIVNKQCVLDTCGFPRQSAPSRRCEGRLDQAGNPQESQAAAKERSDRDLIRRIEHSRRATAGLECAAGQRECREPLPNGIIEREGRLPREIQPLGGARNAARPSQAMGDRDAHVGTAELGDERAVAEFDEAMNNRLRVDEDIDLARRERE